MSQQGSLYHKKGKNARKILKKQDIDKLKNIEPYKTSENEYELQINMIQNHIKNIEKFKRKTYDSYMEDLISKEEYICYISDYDKNMKELQEQKKVVQKKFNLQKNQSIQYDKWVESFKDYINIDKLTRDVVLEFIEKIEVHKDYSITIYYKFQNPYIK